MTVIANDSVVYTYSATVDKPLLTQLRCGRLHSHAPMKIRMLSMRLVGWIQGLLLVFGLLLIGIYVTAYVHKKIISRAELRSFENQRTETHVDATETLLPESGFRFDFSLWSKKRIAEYEDSLTRHFSRPL